MSLKFAMRIPIWILLFVQAGCITSLTKNTVAIELNRHTERLEGWFSARGEWMLFASSEFEEYNPHVEERDKCVSLINATGVPRSNYRALHGKKVVVVGSALRYEDLSSGTSPADLLLSKKYFKNEVVENFCLREFVFVVSAFREND